MADIAGRAHYHKSHAFKKWYSEYTLLLLKVSVVHIVQRKTAYCPSFSTKLANATCSDCSNDLPGTVWLILYSSALLPSWNNMSAVYQVHCTALLAFSGSVHSLHSSCSHGLGVTVMPSSSRAVSKYMKRVFFDNVSVGTDIFLSHGTGFLLCLGQSVEEEDCLNVRLAAQKQQNMTEIWIFAGVHC